MTDVFAVILCGIGVLLPTYILMVAVSPSLSERWGRSLLAHAQAMRDFNALFRLARNCYRQSYRSMKSELNEVTF